MFHFPVSPEKQKELIQRFKKLGLQEKDFQEQFIRSSGSGGQRTNKAATCARVSHSPSGLTVKYDGTRSQGLNRFFAWRLLLEKMEETLYQIPSTKQEKAGKIRRQKKRRIRRARQKDPRRG